MTPDKFAVYEDERDVWKGRVGYRVEWPLKGFVGGLPRHRLERVMTALERKVRTRWGVMPVWKLVEKMVKEGAEIDRTHRLPRLVYPDGAEDTFVDEKQISKTGMGYAEYLLYRG